MNFKVLLLIGAGIALLFYTRKLHHEGAITQNYPYAMSHSESANYNMSGQGY
jgi:hypothetical protein